MRAEEVLDVIRRELKAHGVTPTIERTSKHVDVRWQIPGKQPRVYTTSSTPSDWRTRMNARAEVRRMLRADNVTLDTAAKPRTLTERVVQPPRHVETIPDQVAAMRSELSDLSELIMELLEVVRNTAAVLIPVQRAESSRNQRLDVLAALPADGATTTTNSVAEALVISRRSAYSRLQHLRSRGRAELLPDGTWRRTAT
jgi:hypothetical protein